MSSAKSRIAVAAALAALSAPALASDAGACSVCDDPTFPAIEHPAPAVHLGAPRGEAEALEADPMWPATGNAAPAIHLTPYLAEGPATSGADGFETPDTIRQSAPAVHYAVALGEKPERVTASR